MRTRPIQMNFTAGEWTPKLFGASHLAKYWNAVETLENFVILPYGGLTRRDGLHYVAAQKTETRKARLIPFIFSTEQAYIIEAGHEYMRFYMNHGQILTGPDTATKLLLHMNGADGSQTFLDSSASERTITAQGTAQLDTDQKKFGPTSGLFDGNTGTYITAVDSADFDFSADDIFTFEANVRMSSLASNSCLFHQEIDANNLILFLINSDGSVSFSVANASAWQVLISAAGLITVDTWHHVRAVGNGTNYYLFVDGNLVDSGAITSSMQNFTSVFYIGQCLLYPTNFYGWIDEARISDSARSTSDFAPPVQEFPLLGENDPYEIETPYLEGDLPLLKFRYSTSFDTMYIWHPDHAWRKLTRTGHAAWSLDKVDFTNGPWLEEKTDIVFTPTAISGSITVTSDVAYFQSGHIGSLLRLKLSGAWGHVKITAVATSQSATATVVSDGDLASTADSTIYQEGAWSDVRGHPSAGAFNEASLVAVANDNQPQTAWASKKGNFENFEAGALDDDAFIYTIPASNRILWAAPLRELAFGVGDGIYKMTGGMDDYVSPTNVRVRPGMAIGAMDLEPVPVSNSLLYWQKGGRRLRELTYEPNAYYENYVAPDLTLLADHITTGGIRYSAWQQEPNSALWTVRADGVFLSMTYMRPEDIVGWGRHITDGEIESIAVIPDPTDSFNEVWVSVKRTIDGDIHRYIEWMDPDMMVDSGITYSGIAVNSVSGLDHLEGETVDIVGDGVAYAQAAVETGAVAIDPAASEIQIGLPYTSKIITMKPIINSERGTSAGLPRKWAELWVAVHETSGLTINDEIIDFRQFSDVELGEEIPLYTGNVRVSQLGWGDGRITLEHSDPLPCTILGVFGALEMGN